MSQKPLKSREATQRVPGRIDAQPRDGRIPRNRHKLFKLGNRGVPFADQRVNAGQVRGAIVRSVRLLANRQELDCFQALLDCLAAAFAACLSSGRYSAGIERGLADGAAAGVRGTPGFVLGKTPAGDVIEGTPIRGAQPLETFRRIIDQLLAEPPERPARKS